MSRRSVGALTPCCPPRLLPLPSSSSSCRCRLGSKRFADVAARRRAARPHALTSMFFDVRGLWPDELSCLPRPIKIRHPVQVAVKIGCLCAPAIAPSSLRTNRHVSAPRSVLCMSLAILSSVHYSFSYPSLSCLCLRYTSDQLVPPRLRVRASFLLLRMLYVFEMPILRLLTMCSPKNVCSCIVRGVTPSITIL